MPIKIPTTIPDSPTISSLPDGPSDTPPIVAGDPLTEGRARPDFSAGVQKPVPTPGPVERPTIPDVVIDDIEVKPPAQPAASVWERVKDVFTGELRRTPETEDLPELVTASGVDSGSFWGNLETAAGLMFAAGDEAKKDIIKGNFPDVKFRENAKGTTIIEFPDGKQAVLNRPGLSFQDAAGLLGDIALFYGPTKLAGLQSTLARRVGAGALGAGLTEAGRQKGAQVLGSRQRVDPASVGAAATLGGLGETISPLVAQAIRGRRARAVGLPKETGPEVTGTAARGAVVSEVTGIPLSRAQRTLDPTDIQRQSYLSQLSGSSKKAADFLKNQNRASYIAVETVLDQIAPPTAVGIAPGKTRTAAQLAVEAQQEARKQLTSPLYQEAFRDRSLYEVPKTLKLVETKIKSWPKKGSVARPKLNRVRQLLRAPKATTDPATGRAAPTGQTLRQLHKAKVTIDQLLARKGTTSVDNITRRELTEIQNRLVKELAELSEPYDQARRTFAAQSPALEELKLTAVGRISELTDDKLDQVASQLFDVKQGVNPATVSRSRKLIEEQDPQTWRDIVRYEFEKRLGGARSELSEAEELTENIPGQLQRALFGNTNRRRVLYAAIPREVTKNVRYLEEALSRAAKGRGVGSQTAIRQELGKEMRQGVIGSIRRAFKSPIDTLVSVGDDTQFNRRASQIADLMFNPKYESELAKLRKLNPESKQAGKFMDRLLKEAETLGRVSTQELRSKED